MHTYLGKETTFNYNTDFSGDVEISCRGEVMMVPGEDILRFVAYTYVLLERISQLEEMDYNELLTGKTDNNKED